VIDYSKGAGLALPKGKPKLAERDEKRDALAALDLAENRKARKRAGGRCEVKVQFGARVFHCTRKDAETHHLIGGIGRRNSGKSVLADYKLRVCTECHRDITGNKLQPTTKDHTWQTARYRRVR
jgi:hypothetical protein